MEPWLPVQFHRRLKLLAELNALADCVAEFHEWVSRNVKDDVVLVLEFLSRLVVELNELAAVSGGLSPRGHEVEVKTLERLHEILQRSWKRLASLRGWRDNGLDQFSQMVHEEAKRYYQSYVVNHREDAMRRGQAQKANEVWNSYKLKRRQK